MGRRLALSAVALAGIALLGAASLLQRRDSERRSAPLPEPVWRSADRSDAYLRKQLRAAVAGDSAAFRRVSQRLRDCRFIDSSEPVRFRMTRVLNSGHEFVAVVGVVLHEGDSGPYLELHVKREAAAPQRLRIALRDGVVGAIEQADSASIWQPWTGGEDVPLALGDLHLGEVLDVCSAFVADSLVLAGSLDGLGSRPQLVLEATLDRTPASTPATAGDSPARATRALVYVNAATSELGSVRILDAKGYVVRTYQDFGWDGSAPHPRLVGLEVTSVATNSRTTYARID